MANTMALFSHSLLFLAAILVAAALAFLLLTWDRARYQLAVRVLGSHVANVTSEIKKRRAARRFLVVFGFILISAAICAPQWGIELLPVTDLRGSLVVAVDVSLSMGAKDLKPNRLEHARMLLNELADRFAEYRIGIVAFSGKAYIQCPITDDAEAIKYFSSQLHPGMLPMQGTDFRAAIERSLEMTAKFSGTKVLVLITDGEDHSNFIDVSIRTAQQANLKIFTIGMGSPEGELIPIEDSMGNVLGYKKDKNDKPVVSRLDEKLLMKIAAATGAAYIRYTTPNAASDTVLNSVNKLTLEKTKGNGRAIYKNRYQWPLVLAFIVLLIELLLMDRSIFSRIKMLKHKLVLLLAIGIACTYVPPLFAARAGAVSREAFNSYSKGDFQAAQQKYEQALSLSPKDAKMLYNFGAAQYKNGSYDEAKETFEKAAANKDIAAEAEFNKANSSYKAQDIKNALLGWRETLKLNPSDKNAKFNIQKALTDLQNNQDKKQQNKNNNQNNKDNKDNQEQKNNPGNKDNKGGGQNNQDKQSAKDKQEQEREQFHKMKEEMDKQERERAEQLLRMMSEKEKADADRAQQALSRKNKNSSQVQVEKDW